MEEDVHDEETASTKHRHPEFGVFSRERASPRFPRLAEGVTFSGRGKTHLPRAAVLHSHFHRVIGRHPEERERADTVERIEPPRAAGLRSIEYVAQIASRVECVAQRLPDLAGTRPLDFGFPTSVLDPYRVRGRGGRRRRRGRQLALVLRILRGWRGQHATFGDGGAQRDGGLRHALGYRELFDVSMRRRHCFWLMLMSRIWV